MSAFGLFQRGPLKVKIYKGTCAMPDCDNTFESDQPHRKYCDNPECSGQARRKTAKAQQEKKPRVKAPPKVDTSMSNRYLAMALIRKSK